MRRFIPLAVLTLMACSPTAEPANRTEAAVTPVAAPPPARSPSRVTPPPLADPVADTQAMPKPGALNTFGDWTVGCDNVLRCTLGSLLPELDIDPQMTINITREAGPAGTFTIGVESRNAVSVRPPASLAVDGKPVGDGLADAGGGAIAAAMARGRVLTIRDARGTVLFTVSLKGASAALRYIDAQQGRAGSVDAIVAKGARPSRAEKPALPTIVALLPRGASPLPTAAQLAQMRRDATCDIKPSETNELFNPETHALGGGRTLVILPCSTGAYNLIGALFVVDAKGVTPAVTDAPVGFGETGADSGTSVPSVVNGGFERGVLTSYAKGRGLGDCGVYQSFVWDGARFRLSEQSEMGECRGNIDYITTWRTTVARR